MGSAHNRLADGPDLAFDTATQCADFGARLFDAVGKPVHTAADRLDELGIIVERSVHAFEQWLNAIVQIRYELLRPGEGFLDLRTTDLNAGSSTNLLMASSVAVEVLTRFSRSKSCIDHEMGSQSPAAWLEPRLETV